MDDSAQLRLERDLFLRLLELGDRDDLRPLLGDALSLVVEITGAERGYIEARGAAGRRFFMARGLGDEEIEGVRRELSTGIIREAIDSGRTVSTASAAEDPRFRDQQSVRARRIQAVLCAPVGGLGVLYLQGRAGPGPFPEAHRQLAEVFARHLRPLVDRLLDRADQKARVDHTAEVRKRLSVDGLVGQSEALAAVLQQALVAAPVPVPVLITGESGTGKTALARAIHQSSPRARGPFVEVNCAAIPEALFESELFGAERGAHSTANRKIAGKIEAAEGGTLFLDEVAELAPAHQSKLLMFLQSKRYYRLGSTSPLDADVRVLAATNARLDEAVAERKFREDLYYRLNVLEVRMPALRERPGDVGAIAEALVVSMSGRTATPLGLSHGARLALEEAPWPGNVRQLENVLQRGWAVALSEGATQIETRHLFPARAAEGPEPVSYQDALRRFQASYLRKALDESGWNVSETARRVGLSRSHLNDLMKAHGVTRGA
jgi:Nif-specific regulatory protein